MRGLLSRMVDQFTLPWTRESRYKALNPVLVAFNEEEGPRLFFKQGSVQATCCIVLSP